MEDIVSSRQVTKHASGKEKAIAFERHRFAMLRFLGAFVASMFPSEFPA